MLLSTKPGSGVWMRLGVGRGQWVIVPAGQEQCLQKLEPQFTTASIAY
jgi:hypothetical protein